MTNTCCKISRGNLSCKRLDVAKTHVGDEMKEGVAAQRADSQRHQEAEEELEENSVHERDEDDAEQGEQADDRDGDEPADPRCNAQIRHLS